MGSLCRGRPRQRLMTSAPNEFPDLKLHHHVPRVDASRISQMKAMEDEDRRLKRMYADLSMQADLLKEALGKK